MSDAYDVAILGGGLAGLTLARQIKLTRPDTSIVVLEKREGPPRMPRSRLANPPPRSARGTSRTSSA